ncbi:mannitol-1-phosphate 5-dehydrogenase [Rhizodiscina lignyota]|uniref:Mannitol-1-phosphate 5-dehydrogenase n=1 Tax=Rhizodiscina lignyota TaxID=1504668 RepID=A0A9P4IDL1_9PEZI|nr:mannitol-1-phosphate 5-dehydrogenase [Rhizodiscina lignyota]
MTFEKRAVHFGGGNIGRGFVAEFLHNSGYYVTFVDVMDPLIEQLQSTPSYTVTEIGEEGRREFKIDHYQAINSKYEEAKVIEEIAKADTVTCAVGPNILKFIGPVIAKGIEARKLDYPLAVIACENMIGGTDKLKEFIDAKLSDDTKANLKKYARFANSAIDRIVPQQPPNSGLNVLIERFFEWCVDATPFKDVGTPSIKGVHFVDDLHPYIERKLFTVNTSHATAAYYAHNRHIPFIHEAMANQEIHDIVRDCIRETANLIVKKYDHVSTEEQSEYVEAIVKRISNHELKDNVERVGRAPLRKLGRKERFIGPASQLAEMGEKCDCLVAATEMAFRFQNVEGDEESTELAKIMKENDAKSVVEKVCGLEPDHPLFAKVVPIVEKVQADTK